MFFFSFFYTTISAFSLFKFKNFLSLKNFKCFVISPTWKELCIIVHRFSDYEATTLAAT